jgi:hypothetical protein
MQAFRGRYADTLEPLAGAVVVRGGKSEPGWT